MLFSERARVSAARALISVTGSAEVDVRRLLSMDDFTLMADTSVHIGN